mmetsp:Transcript_3049/g.5256  ORF Transcript_3049/g.5256 Transcript_3049/m.5256 type:complete len:98 (+) Transcript_3049:191-484(+)
MQDSNSQRYPSMHRCLYTFEWPFNAAQVLADRVLVAIARQAQDTVVAADVYSVVKSPSFHALKAISWHCAKEAHGNKEEKSDLHHSSSKTGLLQLQS